MKYNNLKIKGRKGIAPIIIIPILLALITFSAVIIAVMPIIFLKVNLVQMITFEYNYNNAQLALNTLLSLTKTDTTDGQVKPVYKIISEYVSLPQKPNILFLRVELNRMVNNGIFKCYKLTSQTAGELARGSCDPTSDGEYYKAVSPVLTPTFVDRLELMVD